ncbi:MAG: aminotransferase class III-fold pyridoxal phosphate-dependent enzyme [Chloroflexota bacterium]|nr:aminotransferase class III-fold pyridoxal phosphate-dependent enzyme [Chloroflexota bacterium]
MTQTPARPRPASFFPATADDLPTVVRAEGVYLYDADGRAIIDAAGGVGCVTSVGHGNAEVVDAISEQMHAVAFLPWTQFQSPTIRSFADAVAAVAPGSLNRVALFNSGSEVTEGAVKLARQYWLAKGRPEKSLIVARWQGFHGMTLGATGFGGHTGRRRRYVPMLQDMPKIPPAYAYRCDDCAGGSLRCADELERMIKWQGPENVACFIAEPVVGATMGAVPAPPGYFQRIREICDRYDVLMIQDEVMTGFGRTGRWFATEHWDVAPDILVAAKGASGGYAPLAVLVATDEVVEALEAAGTPFVAGHTYAQNPVIAAAGIAVLDCIKKHDLVRAAGERGAELLGGLRGLVDLHPILGDARGMGLMLGLELVTNKGTKQPFPSEDGMAYRLARACIAEGAAVYPGQGGADGLVGDHVLVTPPLTITSGEISSLVGAIDRALSAVEADLT